MTHISNIFFLILCEILLIGSILANSDADISFGQTRGLARKRSNRDRVKAKKESIVTLNDGVLRGKKDRAGYHNFIGIRYGQAPTGDRRFKAALPEPAWKNQKKALSYGEQCPQVPVITNRYSGNEDCLFLNVYLKDFPPENQSLPVMFYIHGGGFKGGAGNFPITGPEYLIQENVILVTINYRLGPLGFLNLNLKDAPGNAGLQDQILALKWVQRNIDGFGGNPNDITIFGQSAGAIAVDALIMSPAAKGLFHKAITQSGSILNPWAVTNNPIEQALRLGRKLGFIGNKTSDLLKFLKKIEPRKMIEASMNLDAPNDERNFMNIFFAPSVEQTFECSTDCITPVLTKHPLDIIKSGSYNHVPYLTGFTSDEGIVFFRNKRIDTKAWSKFQNSNIYFVPSNIKLDTIKNCSTKIAEKIGSLYIGNNQINVQHVDNLIEYVTDIHFVHGITEALRYHVKNGNNQTYGYRFSYDGRLNFFKKFIGYRGPGVAHGDELGYLFTGPRILYSGVRLSPHATETIMKNRMVKMWTNFAKYGNPTPNEQNFIDFTWMPNNDENVLKFLNINNNFEILINPNEERMLFWDNFFDEHVRIQ